MGRLAYIYVGGGRREVILTDFRFALRQVRRFPGLALTAILSLALGIGAATAIFSVIHGVVLDPFPYKDVDTLMSIKVWDPARPGYRTYYNVDQFLEFRDRASIFSGVTLSTISDTEWTGRPEPQRLRGNHTTFDGLEIMGVPPVLGRIFTTMDAAPGSPEVCVLGYRFWQRQFGGDSGVLGQRMLLNGKYRTVVGVMPPRFMWRGADVYMPLTYRRGVKDEGVYFVHVLGRLKAGVTEAQVEIDLRPIVEDLRQQDPSSFPEKFRVGLLSFAETFPSGLRDTLLILFAAVGLLLLIACANVSNLLLSRALAREREMAVRASLGAGRGRLIRQLLTESLVIALAGGALGVLLAWVGMKAILQVVPPFTIPDEAEVALNWPVLAFSLGISILTAVVFGLAPAWQGSRADLAGAMRESGRGAGGSKRQSWLRNGLVISEVALSAVLLVGAGLMIRSLLVASSVNLGIQADRVLTVRIPLSGTRYATSEKRRIFFDELLRRMKDTPGIEAAAVNSWFHPFGNFGVQVQIPGAAAQDSRRVVMHPVSAQYAKVLGIGLRQGRFLNEDDTSAVRMSAVVNEAFVRRYLDGRQPLGAAVRIPRVKEPPVNAATDMFEIVGVAGDAVAGDLKEALPEIYVPNTIASISDCLVARTAGGDPMAIVGSIRAQVQAIDKDQPIHEPMTLDSMIARRMMAGPRFHVVLFGVFAGIGLLLAAVGIYGVMSNAVVRRTQEIGVRMALGASRRSVVNMVVGQGARLLGIGLALGLAGGLAASRFVQKILIKIAPGDPAALAMVTVTLVLVGLLAVWLPARRASRIDPVNALRHE